MQFPENNRFTYIIGNNGSGKSCALEENAERLCQAKNVIVIATGASDKFKFRSQIRKTDKGSYRYLGNRTVGNGTHNGTLAANAVTLFLAVPDEGLKAEFKNLLKEIGFDGKIGIAYRKTKFSKTKAFDTQELTGNFAATNKDILNAKERPFEAVFYKGGTPFLLSDLSSGEQYIITTALKIVTSIETGACYFIDEPEVSLHVEWQVKWPERFHPLLSLRKDVSCYIATHSPVIISSALKAGADCYSLAHGELAQINEKEFNVERILLREFNTITPDNKFVFEELAAIVSRTIDRLEDKRPGVDLVNDDDSTAEALASVERLKKKLTGASQTVEDGVSMRRTLNDFEMAIKDLTALPKDIEEPQAPPKGAA